jgi:hypothetical protein
MCLGERENSFLRSLLLDFPLNWILVRNHFLPKYTTPKQKIHTFPYSLRLFPGIRYRHIVNMGQSILFKMQ